MTSDIERTYAHAKERATWQPSSTVRIACRGTTFLGSPKPPDHANCGGCGCGCRCHAPTDAERALWQQIADEAEHYLTLREAAEELGLATLDGGD